MFNNNYYVKSFVIRSNRRMTKGQKHGLKYGFSKFCLPSLTTKKYDFDTIFGRKANRILEIGFGMGDSIVKLASQYPEKDFIGIEVYKAGIGSLLNWMLKHNINNVRIFNCDAIQVLNNCINNSCLDSVLIFFPDPWHKKRHNKRRIIQVQFLNLVNKKLKIGGSLHIATDCVNYSKHILEAISKADSFGFLQAIKDRPLTKFENRCLSSGNQVIDLLFERLF